MPEIINWSFSVGVAGGPRIAGSDRLEIGAYDKVSVNVAAGDTEVDVDIQPATTPGRVHALVVGATAYDADITFSADGGTTETPLLGPLVLIGAGAVELLHEKPRTLQLGNNTADDVTIDILVGRDPAP